MAFTPILLTPSVVPRQSHLGKEADEIKDFKLSKILVAANCRGLIFVPEKIGVADRVQSNLSVAR